MLRSSTTFPRFGRSELGLNGYASLPGRGMEQRHQHLPSAHFRNDDWRTLPRRGRSVELYDPNQINSQNVSGAQLSCINVSTTGGSLERLAVLERVHLSAFGNGGRCLTELNMLTGLQERGGLGNRIKFTITIPVTIDVGDRDGRNPNSAPPD